MIAEIYSDLLSVAEAALSVNVVKGFPKWGRPTVTPPIAALEINAIREATLQRIGDVRQVLDMTLYVFAEHEPGLALLLDRIVLMKKTTLALDIAGQVVQLRYTDGQRYENQSGTQQEDHGFSWSIAATY